MRGGIVKALKTIITSSGAFLKKVNQVQIDALGEVLQGFQPHLLSHGGLFVGISSFSALYPPLYDCRLAYPSSKAYLDMALRCLRNEWDRKVKVVTVHLGSMEGGGSTILSHLISPSYSKCAHVIVRSLAKENIPNEINYPHLHCLVYKFFLNIIPDPWYFSLFRIAYRLAKLRS